MERMNRRRICRVRIRERAKLKKVDLTGIIISKHLAYIYIHTQTHC